MPTLLELFGGDGLLGFGFLGSLVAEPSAAGHFYAASFVHSEALGSDDVAFFDDVFDVLGGAFGEFGNVDESIFTREHFHEGAELGDGNDLAGVNLAHFDFLEHAVDHRFRAVEAFLLGSVNVHGAVVLNVDLGAGLGLDALVPQKGTKNPGIVPIFRVTNSAIN